MATLQYLYKGPHSESCGVVTLTRPLCTIQSFTGYRNSAAKTKCFSMHIFLLLKQGGKYVQKRGSEKQTRAPVILMLHVVAHSKPRNSRCLVTGVQIIAGIDNAVADIPPSSNRQSCNGALRSFNTPFLYQSTEYCSMQKLKA